MKSVIFNADDFGESERTNLAVIRCHRSGVLTSASLMVNEPAADQAARLAHENGGMSVGLHLALSAGRASTVSAIAPQGSFRQSPAFAGIAYYFSSAARRAVHAEVAAQFQRFAATKLAWSHVDGHQHLHLHPVVWEALVNRCDEYGVRCVRIPCEEFLLATPGRLSARRLEWTFFRALRRRRLRSVERHNLIVADRVYGHLETGSMTESYLISLIDRLPDGVSEIYSHPGTPHARRSDGDHADDDEERALLSTRVRERLAELRIARTSYAELAGLRCPH